MNHHSASKAPRRKDDRIVLQFDYDCFYAQVYENKDPTLKGKPLGVKQKNILATCNYAARRQGVQKLQLVVEARKVCPSLVLIDGEDLTPFRDVSKILFNFLRSYSWSGRVERLGLDEVFMDVTDTVDYNFALVNRNALGNTFFHLSSDNPEQGFVCDLSTIAGCVRGDTPTADVAQTADYLRLCLGSHLARYLRVKLEKEFNYTSTCGIATNKTLAKLVGAKHKPRNQTTLLALGNDAVEAFMDSHTLRSVPGIGFKMASVLEASFNGAEHTNNTHEFESTLTVGQVRLHPSTNPGLLQRLLAGPGAEKGVGARLWALLHGVDPSEVKEAGDIPSQISIEDTFKGLETIPQITEELFKLSCSLVRRMRTDLLIEDDKEKHGTDALPNFKWLARPKTLRLSIRSWPATGSLYSSFSRTSRSGPLPGFIFETKADMETIAERLVSETLLPLLRRLQTESKSSGSSGRGGQKWNLQLINICVTNMVLVAADDKMGVGRDIAHMFRNQDELLAPWRVVTDAAEVAETGMKADGSEEPGFEEDTADATEGWEAADHTICPHCGHPTPQFAIAAHLRYHEMGE